MTLVLSEAEVGRGSQCLVSCSTLGTRGPDLGTLSGQEGRQPDGDKRLTRLSAAVPAGAAGAGPGAGCRAVHLGAGPGPGLLLRPTVGPPVPSDWCACEIQTLLCLPGQCLRRAWGGGARQRGRAPGNTGPSHPASPPLWAGLRRTQSLPRDAGVAGSARACAPCGSGRSGTCQGHTGPWRGSSAWCLSPRPPTSLPGGRVASQP